jgi:hypothetical protein
MPAYGAVSCAIQSRYGWWPVSIGHVTMQVRVQCFDRLFEPLEEGGSALGDEDGCGCYLYCRSSDKSSACR